MSFVFLYGPDRDNLGSPSIGGRILSHFSHQLEWSSVVYNEIPRGIVVASLSGALILAVMNAIFAIA